MKKNQIWQILGEIIFDRSKLVSFKISYADLDPEILNETSRLFQMRESNLERLIDFKNIKFLKLYFSYDTKRLFNRKES